MGSPAVKGYARLGVNDFTCTAVPAAWEIVMGLPATVTEALRPAADRLGAALSATLPMPVPLAPLVTVTQLAVLEAVQPHPVPVITLTGGFPPLAATVMVPGLTV